MNQTESRAIACLSFISASRLFGLFMLLPVLPLYINQLPGYTPLWAGIALGIYGFPQALFQIPAGRLSDWYGRPLIIFIGLVIFFIGSLIAALSDSMTGLLIGRFLQGSGAISSSVVALLTDLVREESRAKSMAFFGMTLGAVFCLAMVVGPMLASSHSIADLFWITTALSLVAMLLIPVIPKQQPVVNKTERMRLPIPIKRLLKNPMVITLSLGAGMLHFTLIGFFMLIPNLLFKQFDLPLNMHAWIYLGLLLFSFVTMLPFLIISEKKNMLLMGIPAAIILLIFSFALIYFFNTFFVMLVLAIWLYFSAFNFLEATFPALLSRQVSIESKGGALGIYSSCQFLGAGLGGAIFGFILEFSNDEMMILGGLLSLICWLFIHRRLNK